MTGLLVLQLVLISLVGVLGYLVGVLQQRVFELEERVELLARRRQPTQFEPNEGTAWWPIGTGANQ